MPPEERENGLRAPDLEQVRESAPFDLAHVLVSSVANVAANEPRPLFGRKSVEDFPETRHAADSGMALAGLDVHAQRNADGADEVRVEVVARASRLLRIVAEFRAFLMSEDRLDGVVDVERVRVVEQLVEDVLFVSREPRVQFALVRRLERSPHAVLADDAAEPEQLREYRVVSKPIDVGIPCEPADDCEDGCADDVADPGRVRARIAERGVYDEPVKEAACLQVGHEIGEPAPLRDLRFRTPGYVEFSSERRNIDGLRRHERPG